MYIGVHNNNKRTQDKSPSKWLFGSTFKVMKLLRNGKHERVYGHLRVAKFHDIRYHSLCLYIQLELYIGSN